MTRPGSILEPADRLVYQALVEQILPTIENQLDRTRTFSHIPSTEDDLLFQPSHTSWEAFQGKVGEICASSPYILRSDVSNYFETIPQHQVVNLISSGGADNRAVNLLEEMLLAFRQRNSSGIIQGIFPSDVLGNYYLVDFDADCDSKGLPSARYVDDIFVGFDNEQEAKRHLVRIIERLRRNGLNLNAAKTAIEPSVDVIRQEQAIDRLFNEARAEIENEAEYLRSEGYGFQGEWIDSKEEPTHEELDLIAVRRLLEVEDTTVSQTEKIHRFCLPLLRGANDDTAIMTALEGISLFPHLTRLYSSYLTQFANKEAEIAEYLHGHIVDDEYYCDYQRMYALAAILTCETVNEEIVQKALSWLESSNIGPEAKAICAIFVSKYGVARQKRAVRLHYESEQSEYVRSAILYSARFWTTAERRSAKQAWGRQNPINSLIRDSL